MTVQHQMVGYLRDRPDVVLNCIFFFLNDMLGEKKKPEHWRICLSSLSLKMMRRIRVR